MIYIGVQKRRARDKRNGMEPFERIEVFVFKDPWIVDHKEFLGVRVVDKKYGYWKIDDRIGRKGLPEPGSVGTLESVGIRVEDFYALNGVNLGVVAEEIGVDVGVLRRFVESVEDR